MLSPLSEIGDRFKSVREATGLLQRDFVALLNDAAKALYGARAPRFDAPRVSKLENGRQEASIMDVAIYATVDPLRRGKLWVGWSETADSALGVAPDPRFTTGEMAPVEVDYGEDAHEAAQRAGETKPAAPRKGGRIGNGG